MEEEEEEPYVLVDEVAGSNGGQEAGQIGTAIGDGHEEAGETRCQVQVIDFEARVDAAIQAHTNGENGHGQSPITSSV